MNGFSIINPYILRRRSLVCLKYLYIFLVVQSPEDMESE